MHTGSSVARRLVTAAWITSASLGLRQAQQPKPAHAANLHDAAARYRLTYPDDGWMPAPKPVRTHLVETLYKGPAKGLSYGVTVDPVKIDSLEDFGTPEQVADRVLSVEETRDGVFTVELRSVQATAGSPSYYTIEYAVDSSRGKKVYLCKYCISARKLYVLQTQALLNDFDAPDRVVSKQLRGIIDSFVVEAS